MLYTLHKNIAPSSAVESALADLRRIIAHRIQSHFSEQHLPFNNWLKQEFNGSMIKADIAQNIPQLSHPNEWIILMLALVPHISPDFFESIIAEQMPAGGDFATPPTDRPT